MSFRRGRRGRGRLRFHEYECFRRMKAVYNASFRLARVGHTSKTSLKYATPVPMLFAHITFQTGVVLPSQCDMVDVYDPEGLFCELALLFFHDGVCPSMGTQMLSGRCVFRAAVVERTCSPFLMPEQKTFAAVFDKYLTFRNGLITGWSL